GTTFEGISPHPLCCPARAEILTGQFAQNNGVLSNTGPHGGYRAFDTSSTLATWLHDAGYGTAFMGKFLNGYSARRMDDPTPGWDEWHPTVAGVYNYTDFTIDHNGVARQYADAYQTDVYAKLGAHLIGTMAAKPAPFFMWQSFVAPHGSCQARDELRCWGPPVPAQRHASEFPNAMPPSFSDPAFNEADVSDKPSFVRGRARIHAFRRAHILNVHRMRLRALQAVDQAVHRMFTKLAESGELDNTLIIFTSDNGYLLGEHRLSGKNQPYEQALKVPFVMRGPGVPGGVALNRVGATVDIAATIAAAAGVTPGLTTDGHNLLDVATGEEPGWTSLLIQAGAKPAFEDREDWFFRGVRTQRYTYVFYPLTGEQELYDRRLDPSELTSVVREPRYRDVRVALQQRLNVLMNCAGDLCRARFGPLPRPTR
ncbi:MAG: sulfatase, partial [Nocardioidaceae bacterium]